MKNRSISGVAALLFMTGLLAAPAVAVPSEEDEIPITIRELDVRDTIREFQRFEQRLEEYRSEVTEGQKTAAEIAEMLQELRRSANPENGMNEEAILDAIGGYVEGVVGKQAQLVDFLQSQRYRISYYANRMVSRVRPQDVALLFGTEHGNLSHLRQRIVLLDKSGREIAQFIDGLSDDEFDRKTFQPLPSMSSAKRRTLSQLELRYQNSKNGLDLAKSRLRLVRKASRATASATGKFDINIDVLLSQMFGALDRIRLQMSRDLLYLETFLGNYEHSARTHEILHALTQLVTLQGGLEGPSPGLVNVLDWLEDSAVRKLNVSVQDAQGGMVTFPRSSDLLREAYSKGRGMDLEEE